MSIRKSFRGLSLFALVLVFVAGCVSPAENDAAVDDAYTFLPTSNLPEGLEALPEPLTDDIADLEAAFSHFDISEGPGGEDDFAVDYVGKFKGNAWAFGGTYLSAESSRDRDQATLVLSAPDIEVTMAGFVTVTWGLQFEDAGDERAKVFHNGLLVEVKGEAFKVQTADRRYGLFPVDFEIIRVQLDQSGNQLDLEDWTVFDLRMIELLAQNPFVLKVVDEAGKEHVFDYPMVRPSFYDSREYQGWKAQDYFRVGLEAAKAVRQGLGY